MLKRNLNVYVQVLRNQATKWLDTRIMKARFQGFIYSEAVNANALFIILVIDFNRLE